MLDADPARADTSPVLGHADGLAVPLSVAPLLLPGAGLSMPATIPGDVELACLAVLLQVLESDSGASNGVSFTPGLQLDLGF